MSESRPAIFDELLAGPYPCCLTTLDGAPTGHLPGRQVENADLVPLACRFEKGPPGRQLGVVRMGENGEQVHGRHGVEM